MNPKDKEILYREIFKRNRDSIFRICCCYVSDREERNDVYQNILIHIWESLHTFEGRSEISTWIYRIAVNTCLGYLKSEKRRKKIIDVDGSMKQERIPDESATGEENALEENLMKLYECINLLQPLEKMLISLYLEDLSTKAMAEVVGISEVNVRVKLHRIKKSLKEMMENKNYGS
jgi:RNA polymerase sigma-70 factor, ECF subfamily